MKSPSKGNSFHFRRSSNWFCLAVMFLLTVIASSPLHALVKVGDTAPQFSLKDIKGKQYSLAGSKEKQVTVIYFFDADSVSNRESIKSLSLLATEHGGKLRVLAISGSPRESLIKFVKETNFSFPLLIDDGKVSTLYNAKMILPVVCVIDSDRKILAYHLGGGKALQTMLLRLSEKYTVAVNQRIVKKVNPPKLTAIQPSPITIVTSKKIYRNGDLVSMKISTTRDSFLSLFHIAADNSVTMLIPNQLKQYYLLKTAEPLTFPFEGIELRAASTPGINQETETILAVSTLEPVDFEKQLPQRRPLLRSDLMKAISALPEHNKQAVVTTSYDIREN